ncbi:MAG: M28 family peptidase [Actinomycetota bacterium]|nr:M28 family peptidase [Actinomycetota bacterium]
MPRRQLARRAVAVVGVVALAATTVSSIVGADNEAIPLDVGVMRRLYQPEGHFKAGSPVPAPTDFESALRPLMEGRRFNPSGTYNAFDTNVFEVLGLPYRAAGDLDADDPYGNGGDPRHGFCAPNGDPDTDRERPGNLAPIAGECPNHQLEYSRYFEDTMRDILGEFGVAIHRYRFFNPGSDNTQSGVAINTAAVVPGFDHPDETVIVSGHFDQTNDGPASAWDSAEGHAQVIRIAKIMADYWRATGTRPSATVKFVPWDAEESGTLGSADYVSHNVVPGEAGKVRGYFNTDPCAGGYPAYRRGNPADRVQLGIQLANPDRDEDVGTNAAANLFDLGNDKIRDEGARARMEAFNAKAPELVEQVFDYLDDTVTVAGGDKREVFVSTAEAAEAGTAPDIGKDVVISTSRAVLFSSDWKNFENAGIPFFNPGPEITGPSSRLEPGNPDGIAILHTPLDNLQTLNAFTSADQTGNTFSEGWMKGMEMCAHLLASFMLQPEQSAPRRAADGPVAYFEALPNEATVGKPVRFDAAGSHVVGDAAAPLEYRWDFGDGTTATGARVEHVYDRATDKDKPLIARLTVRDLGSGETDAMAVPVTVALVSRPDLPGPVMATAVADDANGSFNLHWSRVGGGPSGYLVEESSDLATVFAEDADRGLGGTWAVARSEGADSSLHPWQPSQGSPAFTGNQRHRGPSSFWTGVSPPVASPVNQESVLTSKRAIALPASGSPSLSYWSLFQSEGDDAGIVELAVDDADPATAPAWQRVDVTGGVFSAESASQAAGARFDNRVVDLAQFRGQEVLLRFRYVLGDSDRVASQPVGWFVDDIVLEARSWAPLDTVNSTSLTVTGRQPGTYGYRVRALYEDGSATASSAVTMVRVGASAPPAPKEGGTLPLPLAQEPSPAGPTERAPSAPPPPTTPPPTTPPPAAPTLPTAPHLPL